MQKRFIRILKTISLTAIIYTALLGIFYFKSTASSERELWKITDYTVYRPTSVNNLIIFRGYKKDRSIDCNCLYAVNKSTGAIIWSTEELAKSYMGNGLSDFFSVNINLEAVSQTSDVIYISLNYWDSEDTVKYVLFSIRSHDGKILWKVNGLVDSESISDSISKTRRIFVINDQGDLIAIDSDTGKEVWQYKVYQDYDEDYTWFSYHNDIVIVSTHSSECLKCCCTFISDEQQYEQITAYNAETGQPLWETDRLDSGRIYTLNKTLYMVSRPWGNTSEKIFPITKRDDNLVTAIDLETGRKRWDLIFENAHEFEVAAGTKNETLFFIRTYEGGVENFHKLAKILVVDEFTGNSLWQFNDDFSQGNLGYLVDENTVYIGVENGFVYALDTTGNIFWQTEVGGFPFDFSIQDETLIAVHEEYYVSAFDINIGSQKWKLNLGIGEGWSIFWDDILEKNSKVVFVAGRHRIYAIDIKTGDKLWTWSHFRPGGSEYEFGLADNEVLYVGQNPNRSIIDFFMPYNFVRDDWYYALKTEP